MSISVANLDTMPLTRARAVLHECCGSSRWVSAIAARRPFGSREAVLSAADEIWKSLDRSDWREAFSHHPRIGERSTAMSAGERASDWATAEQSGVDRAPSDIREMLAEVNREYEKRFGYIYIVCATGKTAEEMLAIARDRLRNDAETELKVAVEEQRKITRLRLEKLLEA